MFRARGAAFRRMNRRISHLIDINASLEITVQAILFARPRGRICALGKDSFINCSQRRAWKTPT